MDDIKEKGRILKEIVKKYTPQLAKNEIPDNMVKSTAVIRIDVTEITGKYYS